MKLKLTLSSSCLASELCEYCLPAPSPPHRALSSLVFSFRCIRVRLNLCACFCCENANLSLMVIFGNIFKSSKFAICSLTRNLGKEEGGQAVDLPMKPVPVSSLEWVGIVFHTEMGRLHNTSCLFVFPGSAVLRLCLRVAYESSGGHCKEYWLRVLTGFMS